MKLILSILNSLSEHVEVQEQIAFSVEDLYLVIDTLDVLRVVYCSCVSLVYGLFNNLSQW